MPKMRTKGGAAKRFKKTAGSPKHKHAFKNHTLTKMTTKCKRQLYGTSILNRSDIVRVECSLRPR